MVEREKTFVKSGGEEMEPGGVEGEDVWREGGREGGR
jgi:hypothetical protein